MATYTINVRIAPEMIGQLYQQGMSLNFATAVASSSGGRNEFDVVAATKNVAANMSFSLTEEYAIAASTSNFQNGVMLMAMTDTVNIRLGQSYTQPGNMMTGSVNDDSSAPSNGFKFINEASRAAAIVYKKVDGRFAPVYMNTSAPLPRGTETLIPKAAVTLWFSQDTRPGTMISRLSGPDIQLDLSNNSSRTAVVEFTKDGRWSVTSNS